jgi:hypothetical protein
MRWWLALVCVCAFTAVACEDDDTPGDGEATIETKATETPLPSVHPASVRTGWPEVDYVLGLVEERDAGALKSWFLERSIPCRDGPGGAPAPPPCDGHPPGTQLLAFVYLQCGEGTYGAPDREAAIVDAFFRADPQPYAITLRPSGPDPAYRAQFSVFYVADQTFHVLDLNERGRVVSVHHACHQQPFNQVLALHSEGADQWVLAPPASAEPVLSPPPPTPTPSTAPLPHHGPATRTGNDGVDATLDAILSRDPVLIQSRLRFRPVGCVIAPRGIGSPPACPEGAPEGTLIDAISGNSCEGYYLTKEEFAAMPISLDDYSELGLFAVLEREGGFVAMFSARYGTSDPNGIALHLDSNGLIFHVDSGCGEPPGERYADASGTFLLPPP